MTAKAYLKQIQQIESRIRILTRELEALREETGIRGIEYGGERLQRSASLEAPFVRVIERRERLEKQLERLHREQEELFEEIAGKILALDNPVYAEMLWLRYIDARSLQEIADMIEKSYDWTRHLHGEALAAFSDRWWV